MHRECDVTMPERAKVPQAAVLAFTIAEFVSTLVLEGDCLATSSMV